MEEVGMTLRQYFHLDAVIISGVVSYSRLLLSKAFKIIISGYYENLCCSGAVIIREKK